MVDIKLFNIIGSLSNSWGEKIMEFFRGGCEFMQPPLVCRFSFYNLAHRKCHKNILIFCILFFFNKPALLSVHSIFLL